MKNEHLIPVVVLDLINSWKNAKPNSFEKNNLEDRLRATKEKIENELRTRK